MQPLEESFERLGGTLTTVGGITVPERFRRDRRTHRAVRQGVGITRHPWGLVTVRGSDSEAFLDNTLTCSLPADTGDATYGMLLTPDGEIEVDMYVVDTGDAYLCVTAPGTAAAMSSKLADRTFIQEVAVEDVTDEHVIFGIHGPQAEVKLESVLRTGRAPQSPLSLARVAIRDIGITLLRLDGLTGEVGYLAICERTRASEVLDALVTLGAVAVPFGYRTWVALTLEAGTPLFETELHGRQPNVCGQLDAAIDLTKGCFVGQEVVARVANLGQPREKLVGLSAEELPDSGAMVTIPGGRRGEVTRVASSPSLGGDIGMAVVPREAPSTVTIESPTATYEAEIVSLPFVTGSATSDRLPTYDDRSPDRSP